MAEPILRLAELAGVRASYRDAFRVERRIAAENLRAVLAAMGFATESDAAIARETAALEAERWRALLPPAVVVRDSAAPRVGFVLPDRLNAGRILWSLAGEGMRAEGSADPNALDTIETTGKRAHRHRRLDLPLPQLAPGYYRLSAAAGHENAETCLIVAPACAYLPPALADRRRAWGVAAQLYSLRSARNWGMGDFADLGALAEMAAGKGAAALGINPLHALYPAEPRHISPYSPSSRLFLNPLYLDIESVPDFADSGRGASPHRHAGIRRRSRPRPRRRSHRPRGRRRVEAAALRAALRSVRGNASRAGRRGQDRARRRFPPLPAGGRRRFARLRPLQRA